MFQLKKLLVITMLVFVPALPLFSSEEVQQAAQKSAQEETSEVESFVFRVAKWYENNMNYGSITFLMALESSFLPIPSEIIIAPAAYIASNPESDLNFFLVIFFATIGSVIGALVIYGLSVWVGRKALYKFADSHIGSALMLDSGKIKHAEDVFKKRSKTSICVGRFLAGVRLVISIPAGLAKMNLFNFIFYTFIGSLVYNTTMGLIGYFLHGQSDLIHKFSYEVSVAAVVITILFVLVFIIRYFLLRIKGEKLYALIGYPLGHSFSKKHFIKKFKTEKINAKYRLFEIENLDEIKKIIKKNKLQGVNVTIPYKEQIIAYVSNLDETAQNIGAVNVLKITHNKADVHLKGYNTDAIGFEQSIKPYLKPYHKKALILGTGGASKAIEYVLRKLGIETTYVSRTEKQGAFTYASLDKAVMYENLIIVNATPLGTYPKVDTYPDIPYQHITDKHLLFDVVYNPAETMFLKKGKEKGAQTINGEQMLIGQAEAAWNIWQSN